MSPVVETGVDLHEIEQTIYMACVMNDIKDIDTVLMSKEVEHGETQGN